jgi:hypothetical protein
MICNSCGEEVPDNEIQRRRLNTMYHDEESNWLTSCLTCYDDAISYYAELWEQFYGSRI